MSPLESIISHLKVIGSGDYAKKLKIDDKEEYRELTTAINHMQEDVRAAANSLVNQNNKHLLFIRNMNHELRTPLTSIIGYSELLTNDLASPQIKIESAKFLQQEGKRLVKLSKQMSRLMSISKEQHERITVKTSVISEHLKLLYSNMDRENDIVIKCDDFTWKTNHDLIIMYAINIIDNAIKATKRGQIIEVELKHDQNAVVLSVKDNGVGFNSDTLDEVFEPFTKTSYGDKEEGVGNGLGLSICKSIADSLKGTITIESNEGLGSLVILQMKSQEVFYEK